MDLFFYFISTSFYNARFLFYYLFSFLYDYKTLSLPKQGRRFIYQNYDFFNKSQYISTSALRLCQCYSEEVYLPKRACLFDSFVPDLKFSVSSAVPMLKIQFVQRCSQNDPDPQKVKELFGSLCFTKSLKITF